jgi:hypothetical protein
MRTRVLSFTTVTAAVAIVFTCLLGTANAQFTITIPNFPKVKKEPKPTPAPPQEAPAENSNSNSSRSDVEASEPSAKKGCSGGFYEVWSEEIGKTIDDVKSFTPSRDYFVRDFNDNQNKYLKMALSQSYRKDEESDWSDDDNTKQCVNARLDELAAVAEKAIGSYTPVGYTLGTPADKAALRAAVTDISTAQVFQVGVKDMNWKIDTNDIGIPNGRKKLGKLWVKYPGDKYCKIIWANVWQQYAGGGTYNSSTGDFIAWEYAGCPAGK